MPTPTTRRLLALSVSLILSLLPLTSATAGRPPLMETFEYSGTDEVAAHCGPEYGDFDILSTYTVQDRDRYHFRADGTWERLSENHVWDGTLTNSVTGKTVSDGPDHLLITIEFADDGLATSWDTATITRIRLAGQDFHTVVPGQGRLVHDNGVVYVENIDGSLTVIAWHGLHDINDSTNQADFADVYCPILAGN